MGIAGRDVILAAGLGLVVAEGRVGTVAARVSGGADPGVGTGIVARALGRLGRELCRARGWGRGRRRRG